jgi:hypothetical protein
MKKVYIYIYKPIEHIMGLSSSIFFKNNFGRQIRKIDVLYLNQQGTQMEDVPIIKRVATVASSWSGFGEHKEKGGSEAEEVGTFPTVYVIQKTS